MTVLVLRALALGDLLVAVPALRGLRRRYRGHRIVLATAGPLADLARCTGAVDDVLPAAGLAPLRWPYPRPDVVVNLHGRGPRSHQLLDALGPARRIGFTGPGVPPGWEGPPWAGAGASVEHEADRWCRLTGGDPTDLLLPSDATPDGTVVIHPGAAYGCRRWPSDRFAAVARRLAQAGHRVMVTGSAAERGLAAAVGRAAGLPEEAVLAGRTTVLELAATVAAARLLICGDTGVAHLATAYGTPSVLLFGPVSPRQWGPRTDGPHTVLWRPEAVRGARWATDPDPALLALSIGDVLRAATAALDEPAPLQHAH
jgi:ADP-heptose:LPS heptosyltransferase